MPRNYIRTSDRVYPKDRAPYGQGKRLLSKIARAEKKARLERLEEEMRVADLILGDKVAIVDKSLDIN